MYSFHKNVIWLYSYDKDRKYHVLLEYDDIYKKPDHMGYIQPEVMDMINEKYDRDFKSEEWSVVTPRILINYYYTFTADEIFDLADFGICCYYVGSGEGDIDDVDFETEEGIETFLNYTAMPLFSIKRV